MFAAVLEVGKGRLTLRRTLHDLPLALFTYFFATGSETANNY